MNIKKFIALGLISLTVLVGCNTANPAVSNEVENNTVGQVDTQTLAGTTDQVETKTLEGTDAEEPVVEPEVDPAVEKQKAAVDQITALASLIGKSAEESRAILGEPSSSKNLDGTEVLLVDYYKLEYLGEIAKVEVVYNDDKKQVNFVSFTILKADHIEETKENLTTTLTQLYGESGIERIVDKKGKRNLNWTDETLIYDLKYFEDNISLDIYEADQ